MICPQSAPTPPLTDGRGGCSMSMQVSFREDLDSRDVAALIHPQAHDLSPTCSGRP